MTDRGGLGAPATRTDPGALRIGSIGGVDVMVRWSWLIVAALISSIVAPQLEGAAPGLGPWAYVAGLAFAVLLTLSLLLHEVSHALMAKRYGIAVGSITLHFIGGVTQIEGEPSTPRQEFAISAIGPATSLLLGGAAFAVWPLAPEGVLSFVVGGLAMANLIVGVLNLVPGMPLDGGRVLRAAIWRLTGDQHRGTLVSGWTGRGVALVVLASPLLLSLAGADISTVDLVIAAVFGWFLWSAASSAIAAATVRARLPALRARTLARRSVTVPSDVPLAEALRRAHAEHARSVVVADAEGRPVGVMNEAAAEATPVDRRPWVPVSAVSRSLVDGLDLPADLSGEALILAMQAQPASEYVLREPDGRVLGVLVTRDVDAAFASGRPPSTGSS